jgi:hypothetical protein
MSYKINFYFSFIFINFTFLKQKRYERHFIQDIIWRDKYINQ